MAASSAIALAMLAIAHISAQDRPSDYPLLGTPEASAARLRAFEEGLDHVPGEVLIKFRAGVGPAEAASVLRLARAGGQPIRTGWMHDILHARAEGEGDVRDLVAQLARQPEVEWAQPNYIHQMQSVPNDPSYSLQWNMTLLDMPRAWDLTGGGSSSVTVAVIDSGVTTTSFTRSQRLWIGGNAFSFFSIPFGANPEIGAGRIAGSRDFVSGNSPVFDADGHGSHVAGTVLQETNNGLGVAGMAHRTRLLALKVCVGDWEEIFDRGTLGLPGRFASGGCPVASTVAAIQFAADQGAKVINLSLGGVQPSPAYLTALRYARDRGTFVAISAGNNFAQGNPTIFPAFYARDLDGVMAVGAITSARARSFYSSTGDFVEIAAPGGDVRFGSAGGIYQASLFPPDSNAASVLVPRFDRYADVSLQGTSMASPHVAGLAALLYSQGVTNPAAVEAAIKRFSQDLGATGRDNDFGFGLIDPPTTLRGLGYLR